MATPVVRCRPLLHDRHRGRRVRRLGRLATSESSYLGYKSRDRLGGYGNEVDDGVNTGVRRSDLIAARIQPDVQLLVKIRIIAEPYEGLATDRLTRLKLRDPGCRRDCEGLAGALFDVREFVVFNAMIHSHILA
jgi:hypothetical protein